MCMRSCPRGTQQGSSCQSPSASVSSPCYCSTPNAQWAPPWWLPLSPPENGLTTPCLWPHSIPLTEWLCLLCELWPRSAFYLLYPHTGGFNKCLPNGTNQCIWVWRHWIRVYNSCSTFSTMALVTDFPKNNWMEFPNDFSYFTSFPLLILWPLNDTHSSYVLFRWHLHFIWSHSGLVVAL